MQNTTKIDQHCAFYSYGLRNKTRAKPTVSHSAEVKSTGPSKSKRDRHWLTQEMYLSVMWMTKSRSVGWLSRTEAQSGPPVTHQLAAKPQLESLIKTGTTKSYFTGNVPQMISALEEVNHILLKCESWSCVRTWKTNEMYCHPWNTVVQHCIICGYT